MTDTAVMTSDGRTSRILVVTDKAMPGPGLQAAISSRAEVGNVRFRVVVLNPARAELHLLHPERTPRYKSGNPTGTALGVYHGGTSLWPLGCL